MTEDSTSRAPERDRAPGRDPQESAFDAGRVVAPATRLTVLIPAYNEELGIGRTLVALGGEPGLSGAEVVVIDDGSSDRTAEIATGEGATVLRNPRNFGYGAALKKGIRASRRDLVAWFDADGQHDPADLAAMLGTLDRERADAVFGARLAGSHVAKARVPGKLVIRLAAEHALGRMIPDVNCGLRVCRRHILERYLHLLPDGFSASTTLTLILMKRNYHVIFHPVRTAERIGKSSVRQVRDGLRTLHTILRILVLFDALRSFGLAAAIFVATGLVYGAAVAVYRGQGFPVLAAVVVLAGIQTFFLGVVCDQVSAMRLERLEAMIPEDRTPPGRESARIDP